MAKKRLDELIVEKGLVENRNRAKSLILAGLVFNGLQKLEKAGEMVDDSADITVRQKEHPFVSRGGMKLAHALKHFGVEVTGLNAIDVGASTGGFTDCLLQNGAKSVTAIDVGKGQLDWKLRNDERVKVMEKRNAREITADNVGGQFDIAVIDLSFISLELVLLPVKSVVKDGGIIIALVKPQFEAGRAEASKAGGVIKDTAVQKKAVEKVDSFGRSIGLEALGVTQSPIKGAKGNVEFLLWFGN